MDNVDVLAIWGPGFTAQTLIHMHIAVFGDLIHKELIKETNILIDLAFYFSIKSAADVQDLFIRIYTCCYLSDPFRNSICIDLRFS